MGPGEILFLVLYFGVLLALSFYGGHRYHIAYLYYKHKKEKPQGLIDDNRPLPKVTIQLPVFNERYVVGRLIDHVCKIRYPAELLEIQVLDDSTDDTVELAREAVDRWHAKGVNIVHIHRTNRQGFKAGALQEGMAVAHGEFIAVFDADFIPPVDFLERTLPHFKHDGIGMVQTRWDHINRHYSLLTEAQSILLDGHFMIEHTARNRSGRFFNFNGTAGIWRKTCIQDAGGWEHDTLTEDLDLSYRAQMAGWRFVFLNDLLSPAEIPIEMTAFKTQQHRWAKGSIQVALKILPRILKSDLPRKVKFEAFIHLTSNVAYVMMIVLSLMMPFSLHIRIDHNWYQALLLDLPFFLGATFSVSVFYLISQVEVQKWDKWWQPVVYLPFVLALGIGLAVNNAKATLEALFGHESPFVRTPKLAIEDKQSNLSVRTPYRAGKNLLAYIELGLGLYYTYTVLYCLWAGLFLALPFMLLFQFGFLYTGLMSRFQWSFGHKKPVEAEQ
ncbi:glycosyltransferase family 2 protein [Myxococcota bacterium]|nr:glycosyltransferase family 2 protein [Myxococcota bacterium]MBU1433034.1 glycosyltransferase family 2 protein [Myxococcota bacterium]MBU1899931.1 glycosyltransferase family 2 protein [Myxococcota bacterium]